MPLYKNTNQPFFADPNSPRSVDCAGEYCYPVAVGDKIYQQWYQTPCGNNEIADPTFTNATYGANLITNGTFAGSLASWSTTGWVYDTGQAEGPALTNPNDLTQTIAITPFSLYRLQFDLSGLSPGDRLRVYLGKTSGYYYFDENESVDVLVYAGNENTDIVFMAEFTNTAQVLIDNVILTEATFGDWNTNDDWALDDVNEVACADGLGTGLLEESVADYITVGEYYSLQFEVLNYVSGTVTPYIANMPGTAISANGTFTMYATPTLTGVVSFLPSADFVGCIKAPDLRMLRNDYLFEVIDDEDNRYDISTFIEYYQDKVILASSVLDQLELLYGCYTIEVTDRCLVEGIELVTNGNFGAGQTGWSTNGYTHQYDFTGGEMTWTFNPLENGDIMVNGDFSSGDAGWTYAGWTIGTDATHTPGNTSPLSHSVTLAALPSPPATQYTWIQVTMSGRTAGSVAFSLSDYNVPGSFSDNGIWCFQTFHSIAGSVTLSITPTSSFDGTIEVIEVYQTATPWNEGPPLWNQANADIVAGNYLIGFDITATTGTGVYYVRAGVMGQTVALVYKTGIATHSETITNYVPGQQIPWLNPRFGYTDPSGGQRSQVGTITIDNVTLVRVEPFEATYTSECLDYKLEHPNTRMVTGWSNQSAFGFDWVNDFVLQMRVELRSLNPTYNKQRNISQFGTGDASVAYTDQTKLWQLATAYMSESAHDALATIVDCDHFTIGTSDANAIEYICMDDDYTPQWTQDGSYSLAPITLNIRLKTGGMKFNRHT